MSPIAKTFRLSMASAATFMFAASPTLGAAPSADGPTQPGSAAPSREAVEHVLTSAKRLGERAASIRAQVPVYGTVVVVPDDANSYIEAIAAWSPAGRFPVLIDDGSMRAAEDIARFVRAYAPETVVRWASGGESDSPSKGMPDRVPGGVPEHHPAKLKGMVDWALGRSWGLDKPASSVADFLSHLRDMNLTPPGIVLCNPEDPAWTAGLALAAGHGQPIAWVKAPQAAGGTMNAAQAEALVKAADEACRATGLRYDALGDDLDAISLCMNVPSKFPTGEGEKLIMAATSDVVGRRNFAVVGENAQRWAWSSVVWGSRPRAAYAAMCSLFLAPSRAWIFDGYGDEGAFAAFNGTKAGDHLRGMARLEVDVDDKPDQSDRRWRTRSSRPINASLVMVNTMGNADFFDVRPGRLKPADIPLLNIPAAVYFVHSWSAADVSAGSTVAGRWFNHGVFAYLGSVQEPYLHAFVPTPVMAARLAQMFPWAAATRAESAPIWKIACFGDPLWTFGPVGKRITAADGRPMTLKDPTALPDDLKAALKGGDFARAARLLVMTGRDADVARLADSMLADRPASVTSDFVAAALPAFHRADRMDLIVQTYDRLDNQPASDEYLRDVLWLACQDAIADEPTPRLVDLLSRNIRIENRDRDEVLVKAARTRLGM